MNLIHTEKKEKESLEVKEVKIRLLNGCPDGLLGWASCVINGALFLNNIAIRRAQAGELILVYPGKRSRSNQKYFHFNPITREAQQALDQAILNKLQWEDLVNEQV
jgi:DNA-binding cell septation regulator SpoVG